MYSSDHTKDIYFKILCLAIFSILYFLATDEGNRYSSDSNYYVRIAKYFHENYQLRVSDDTPLFIWPPLYPLLLSIGIGWFETYVKILHLCSALLTLTIWFKIGERYIITSFWRRLYMLLLTTSTHMLLISVFVWSEIIFLLLFSLYIRFLLRYLEQQKANYLFLSSIFAALSLLQRNVGIFLVFFVLIGLLVFNEINKKNYRFWIANFAIIYFGSFLWNVKKLIVDQNSEYIYKLVPEWKVLFNIKQTINELSSFFYPDILPFYLSFAITLLILLFIALPPLVYNSYTIELKLLSFLVIAYSVMWFVIPADPSNIDRFMAIITPFLFLSLISTVERLNLDSQQFQLPAKWTASLFLIYPIVRIIKNAFFWSGL